MAQRGRKSAAELSVVARGIMQRPPAPEELSPEAREIWSSITGGYPTDYFGPGDLPLLRAYCGLSAVCNRALFEAEQGDAQSARLAAEITAKLSTVAAKLRICVSSRVRADAAGAKPQARRKPWET